MGNNGSSFVQLAVAKGYLDEQHAAEAKRAQAAAGDVHQFHDYLVTQGWMTREQVAEIDSQLASAANHTGRIQGYKLIAKIGQGGMGAVYRAVREQTGETVALKILPRRLAERADFVERFLREAQAAARIKSEHVVRTVDVGFSGGYYYFAMEFVEGESVDTTLSIDEMIPQTRALRIIYQIALALRDAERAGIVHRDIKPGNILIREDGVAKLADLGLARDMDDASMTQDGVTFGTPNYMSPEQARAHKALDTRSDIYSLGITFYHMVTGTVPFRGETSTLTMLKHLNELPVAPITRRPDISPACNQIILKMLAKNPDERYRTAQELIDDLELAIEDRPLAHAQPAKGVTERADAAESGFAWDVRRRRKIRAAIAIVILAAAALAAYLCWMSNAR